MNQQWKQPLEVLTQFTDGLTRDEKSVLHKLFRKFNENHKEFLFLKEFLGFQIEEVTEKSLLASIPVQAAINNGKNMVHGGVLSLLADATMGIFAAQCSTDGQWAVTSNLSINYISPGRGERLYARAEAIHLGKRTHVMDCEITNERDKLIAKSQATFFVVPERY